MPSITNAKVLIMAANGFEQSELEVPRDTLAKAGADVKIATPDGEDITGWDTNDWGNKVASDLAIAKVKVDDFDVLVLPGGQINPDLLRINDDALEVITEFSAQNKPIAAICHGPWLLIEAKLIDGVTATSYKSIRTDMENAGARWRDEEVVFDRGIITSRNPDDLEAFCKTIIKAVEHPAPMETVSNAAQKGDHARMLPA